ncbi:MAG: hypothetical protein OJF50_006501 [Nitrospira sp.]|nr:hypothetical protein [Nitrospira sp.]
MSVGVPAVLVLSRVAGQSSDAVVIGRSFLRRERRIGEPVYRWCWRPVARAVVVDILDSIFGAVGNFFQFSSSASCHL